MVIEWFYFSCENNPDDRTWMTDVAVHRKQFGHFSLFVRNPDTSSVGSCTKFRFHYSDQSDLKTQAAALVIAGGFIGHCRRLHWLLQPPAWNSELRKRSECGFSVLLIWPIWHFKTTIYCFKQIQLCLCVDIPVITDDSAIVILCLYILQKLIVINSLVTTNWLNISDMYNFLILIKLFV